MGTVVQIILVCEKRMDRRTDGQTDRQTDLACASHKIKSYNLSN